MPKKVTLPSGKTAEIQEGKGKHARMASRMMNGDSSLYMPALMSQLIKIGGQAMTMEDFDEISLADYNVLAEAIGDEANFTSQAKT